MRYKEFRILEQSAPGTVSIVVYFEDNTTQTIEDIPLSVFNSPDFMSVLKDKFKKYKKVVVKYSKVGDTTTQGNPDGKTPDTKNPTVMTTTKPSDDKIAQKPDEVEAPTKTSTWDNPMEVVDIISSQELDNMMAASAAQDERKKTIDKNGDGKDDKTGKILPIIYNDGSLRDPFNTEKIVGYVPGATPVAKKGGGSEGEEGEGGEEGKEGSVGEAEDLAEKLYNAMHPAILGIEFTRADWWGTDEHDVVRAFRQIKNPQQLQLINKVYKERYGSTLGTQLASDYTNYISRFGGINKIQIRQLNEELNRLGYNMTVSSSGAVSIKKV